MEIKCDYCGNYYADTKSECPCCGAPNEYVRIEKHTTPQTIEEFKQWYQEKKLPPSHITRFFIGENYKEARAFGIYKDASTNNVVVYKNKADGTRAIRYEGKDEAFGVNELYQRLLAEIANQKKRR